MKIVKTLLLVCFFITNANAEDILHFSNDDYKARYEQLLEELRCLVCQNQNLADSNAGLAEDLKAEVYNMIEANKSNGEIKDFLTLRYGDFVLYKPPFNWHTFFLWVGPFILLIIAFLILFYHINQRQTITDNKEQLDTSEKNKLADLLSQHGDKK